MIEKMLIDAVENCISEQIDKEIRDKTNEFYNTLIARKDRYIAEVMSGIRVCHEHNPETMCVDYKIMFINRYEVPMPYREGE